jgi:hypothetical protein
MNVSVKLVIKHHPHSCHSCHSSWTSTWPLKRHFFGPRVPRADRRMAVTELLNLTASAGGAEDPDGWIGTGKPWGDHWGHLGLSENVVYPYGSLR